MSIMDDANSIICTACGAPVLDPKTDLRQPCPYCGCLRKTVIIQVSDQLELKEKLKSKAVHAKTKKKVAWSISGDDYQWSTGRWLKLERTFDKEKDLYTEKLVDPATEEVIKDVSEPLSQHTDHGAAKAENAPADEEMNREPDT